MLVEEIPVLGVWLIADFIEHTSDACWDLQFYMEWCYNQGYEPDPAISAFVNVMSALTRTHSVIARRATTWRSR